MKKYALVFATLVLAASAANADDAKEKNLTLAAADLSNKTVWVETVEDAQLRITENLEQKTQDLSEKVNAKLEKQLEDKLASKFE